MFSKSILSAILAASVTLAALAQGGGGPLTPLQEFAGRLRLDEKTQLPAVQQLFADAAKEAAPVAQEMLELRQKLVNVELAGSDTAPILEAYAAAAARMTGLETRVFQQVYALLKPAQQSRAPEAFAMMAGFFQSAPGRGRRGGGGE